MSLGDSILQTASIVRCISVAVTATDHTIFNGSAQAGTDAIRRAFIIGTRDRFYPLQAKSSGPNI